MVGDEGHLSLIFFLDLDVIITLPDVKLCEDLCFGQAVNDIRGKWQRIAIFNCNGIELPVILYEVKLSILLFDKEGRGYYW